MRRQISSDEGFWGESFHRGEEATFDPPSNAAVNLSSSQLTNKKRVSNNINKTNKKTKN